MSRKTGIEWTESTWNPARGCDKVSPGCKHCYAETFAERFRGVPESPFEHGFDLKLVPDKMADPLRWPTSRKIFVNSMSDFFHEQIPDSYVTHACIVMELANWHTYQVLTKRAKRMRELLRTDLSAFGDLAHIWWGVTVENRQHGLPRIEALRQTPAAVRFLSIEPLLEDLGALNLTGIHWVIVGGESGPRCRPMKPEWVRNIRDQCETASVPFFFKQWGGFPKRKYGRELDGATYNAMPAAKHTQAAGSSLRRVMIEEVNGWYPTQTEWIPLAMPLRAEAPSP